MPDYKINFSPESDMELKKEVEIQFVKDNGIKKLKIINHSLVVIIVRYYSDFVRIIQESEGRFIIKRNDIQGKIINNLDIQKNEGNNPLILPISNKQDGSPWLGYIY